MSEHPIQGLMRTAMENLKQMVDVNTIVGDPVTTPDGTVILPISKVGFGFAAGGSEYTAEANGGNGTSVQETERTGSSVAPFESRYSTSVALPFGGGSGGGVSITPIAFLVVGTHGVKVVPLDHSTRLFERLIEQAPQMIDKLQSMMGGSGKPKTPEEQELNDVKLGSPMEPIPSSSINSPQSTL